jgi:hypothetical protein
MTIRNKPEQPELVDGSVRCIRRHPKAPCCGCDGAYDDGCPICTSIKRSADHGVKTDTGHPVFHGCPCCHGVDEPVELCECRLSAPPCITI